MRDTLAVKAMRHYQISALLDCISTCSIAFLELAGACAVDSWNMIFNGTEVGCFFETQQPCFAARTAYGMGGSHRLLPTLCTASLSRKHCHHKMAARTLRHCAISAFSSRKWIALAKETWLKFLFVLTIVSITI